MNATDALTRGREAYARKAWAEAYTELSAAEAASSLAPEDIDRLAASAHLTHVENSLDIWARAHYEYQRQGQVGPAVRCAFWLSIGHLFRGDHTQSNGWLARGERLLQESGVDCVETGYVGLLTAVRLLWSGDLPTAMARYEVVNETARRFNDPDLIAIARMGTGEVHLAMGETERGIALLDDAMADVLAGQVSTLIVGVIYCAVLEACQRLMDVRRSQEWTAAFTRWCESQPDLVPFRGDCMVYRAEVMQQRGAWPDAMAEALKACTGVDEPARSPWAGGAYYRLGELNRLRGDYEGAEEAYRLANQCGHSPQPGLALLRLVQGRTEAAVSALARTLAETQEFTHRIQLLPSYIEALQAAGDLVAADEALHELRANVATNKLPVLDAVASQAEGAMLLVQSECARALTALRHANGVWREMDMPYEEARSRVLMAQACRALGDEDGAQLELLAAREVFQQLGAGPDAERVAGLLGSAPARRDGGLTPRELEVLRLVAAGDTNRAIAGTLVLSEKTVARHVSNIFAKLDLSSRAAATAYAYEHKLV
jgi:DNA-binding NarL/FixJ family response regulator